jgi:hypothetical protein
VPQGLRVRRHWAKGGARIAIYAWAYAP